MKTKILWRLMFCGPLSLLLIPLCGAIEVLNRGPAGMKSINGMWCGGVLAANVHILVTVALLVLVILNVIKRLRIQNAMFLGLAYYAAIDFVVFYLVSPVDLIKANLFYLVTH